MGKIFSFGRGFTIYDPVVDGTRKAAKVPYQWRRSLPFVLWQHFYHGLLRIPPKRICLVMAEVECTCAERIHTELRMKCADRKQAEGMAANWNVSAKMEHDLRDDSNPISYVLPPTAMFKAKHEAKGPVHYIVKEYEDAAKAYSYLKLITKRKREDYPPNAIPQGLSGMDMEELIGGSEGESEYSVQNMGNAVVLRKRTTKTTRQPVSGSGKPYDYGGIFAPRAKIAGKKEGSDDDKN